MDNDLQRLADLLGDILEKYADACLNVHNIETSVLRQKTRAAFNI